MKLGNLTSDVLAAIDAETSLMPQRSETMLQRCDPPEIVVANRPV